MVRRNETIDGLFEAILSLKDKEECYLFFEDVCTIKELQDMSQRYRVANLLTDKKNYNTISAETGMSTATISRVNRSLYYGGGGYRMAIQRQRERSEADAD